MNGPYKLTLGDYASCGRNADGALWGRCSEWRVTLYPEGGDCEEQYVNGPGWVITDAMPECWRKECIWNAKHGLNTVWCQGCNGKLASCECPDGPKSSRLIRK